MKLDDLIHDYERSLVSRNKSPRTAKSYHYALADFLSYVKKHGVKNYLLYTEPGLQPGAVQKVFHVDAYPTLVLLDPWGTVLWTGHPKDLAEAEKVLAAAK